MLLHSCGLGSEWGYPSEKSDSTTSALVCSMQKQCMGSKVTINYPYTSLRARATEMTNINSEEFPSSLLSSQELLLTERGKKDCNLLKALHCGGCCNPQIPLTVSGLKRQIESNPDSHRPLGHKAH